jgi:hypothetical protein
MTKQAPIFEASMTKTGGTAHSVIGASNLFGHWSLVLVGAVRTWVALLVQDMGGAWGWC